MLSGVKTRFRSHAKIPRVVAVYCPLTVNAESIADTFWRATTGPPAIAAPASQLDVKPNIRSPKPTLKTSLLDAVTSHLSPEQRAAATEILVDHFIESSALQHWRGIVWTKVTDRATKQLRDIVTEIDVNEHPIIPQLRQWLSDALQDPLKRRLPPAFPVSPEQDLRQPIAVAPAGFQQLPDFSWSDVERWSSVMTRHRKHFEDGRALAQPLADPVHDDRVRYWQRVAGQRTWFSFSEIVVILGWHAIAGDQQAVVLLTSNIMQQNVSHWWDRDAKPQIFQLERCIVEMRTAAVVVMSLVKGGMSAAQRREMVMLLR